MTDFGTMADFDAMLKAMHDRKLKLVMDLVVNHSSDEHQWFKESRKSRDNPYRDYYHWWPAEKGSPPKRVSFFDIKGDAWKLDTVTNAYYLHYFSGKQPDLNWENPKVRNEIFSMMNFWFEKGVDGFRMDVIPFISKDTAFPVITQQELNEKWGGDWAAYYGHGPYVHQYLKEMHEKSLSRFDVMTVAEGAGTSVEDALLFTDPDRHELNMMYHFEGVSLGYLAGQFKQMDPKGYSLIEFKKVYSKWDSVFAQKGWGTIYLGNHDQPRMLSRWGDDSPKFREASSKLLTTFLLTMRATPYYYAGDEIGMSNIKFDRIEDYRDIETINYYRKLQLEGGDLNYFLKGQKISARDNGRTPFQWDNSEHAGFTTGDPWLKVHPNYPSVNASAQENKPNSILNYFRKLAALRKQMPELIYGKYELIDKNNEKVYAYTRSIENKSLMVILNFSPLKTLFKLPTAVKASSVLVNNIAELNLREKELSLAPWQALVIRM